MLYRNIFAKACIICNFAIICGCVTDDVNSPSSMIGDPYFSKVKSKANVYARQGQAEVLKIAVMPFKATTDLIGASVSDMVVTELLRTQKYSLVERGQMSKVLGEAELAMAGMSESKAVEAAKMLGAEAVVIGTVDEYSTQAKGGETFSVVGLSIRLIDCANGKIIWSADLAKMAKSPNTPLAAHARDVVHEVVAALYQNLTGQAGILPPPPPNGLTVSDMGLREAVICWTPTQYVSKYRIERATNEEGPFITIGDVVSTAGKYRDADSLKDSSVYYYRIRGVGKSGSESDPSEVVETMTAPPPEKPENLVVVSPSSRCVTCRWTAPRSEGITGYRVERAKAGSADWRKVGEVASCVFTDGGVAGCDLEDSTTYSYRVIAVNRVGAKSECSAESSTTTPPPPKAPADFVAKSFEIRNVPLRWVPNNEDDVTGYELERAGEDGVYSSLAKLSGRLTAEYRDGKSDPGNLPDETAYSYRLRAVNNVGSKSEWAVSRAVTKPAPAAPTGLVAEEFEAGKIRLSWNANEEPDIEVYRLESRSPNGWFWSSVANTPELEAFEANLSPGEMKEYRLMAVGPKNHQGGWCEPVQGTARPLPTTPSGLYSTQSRNGVTVFYKCESADLVEFRVYKKKFLGQELLVRSETLEAEVPASKIGPGIDVVVTAVDKYGLESKPSEKIFIR